MAILKLVNVLYVFVLFQKVLPTFYKALLHFDPDHGLYFFYFFRGFLRIDLAVEDELLVLVLPVLLVIQLRPLEAQY